MKTTRKKGRSVGPAKKPKAGLTPHEERVVAVASRRDIERWQYLFSMNVWREVK